MSVLNTEPKISSRITGSAKVKTTARRSRPKLRSSTLAREMLTDDRLGSGGWSASCA